MKTKLNAASPHTSQHDNNSITGGRPSSLINAKHRLAGQMDIYDVLADIAAGEGGA